MHFNDQRHVFVTFNYLSVRDVNVQWNTYLHKIAYFCFPVPYNYIWSVILYFIGCFNWQVHQISLFPATVTDSGCFQYVDSLFSCLTIFSTMCCPMLSCLAVIYRFDERLGQDPRACSTVSSCESQRQHLALIVESFSPFSGGFCCYLLLLHGIYVAFDMQGDATVAHINGYCSYGVACFSMLLDGRISALS